VRPSQLIEPNDPAEARPVGPSSPASSQPVSGPLRPDQKAVSWVWPLVAPNRLLKLDDIGWRPWRGWTRARSDPELWLLLCRLIGIQGPEDWNRIRTDQPELAQVIKRLFWLVQMQHGRRVGYRIAVELGLVEQVPDEHAARIDLGWQVRGFLLLHLKDPAWQMAVCHCVRAMALQDLDQGQPPDPGKLEMDWNHNRNMPWRAWEQTARARTRRARAKPGSAQSERGSVRAEPGTGPAGPA